MKTLSIKNPWGYLIAKGIKDVENRSWPTKYRGEILIHVSQKWDSRAWFINSLLTSEQWQSLNDDCRRQIMEQTFTTSAIIGSVEIVDCIQNSKSIWAESGQWHWVLKNPKLFERPILNVKGKLGLWEYELINTKL